MCSLHATYTRGEGLLTYHDFSHKAIHVGHTLTAPVSWTQRKRNVARTQSPVRCACCSTCDVAGADMVDGDVGAAPCILWRPDLAEEG